MKRLKAMFDSGQKRIAKSRYARFLPLYEGLYTFFYSPRRTSENDVQIYDAVDLKRVMMTVIIALLPCLFFGMYNVGYQHFTQMEALGAGGFTAWKAFVFGLKTVLPILVVSYATGLSIEFFFSWLRGRAVEEGFLVSGLLIAIIMPPTIPLWIVCVSTAFAVVVGKELFGGTGMNIWNPALLARAFAFFAYPTYMTGSKVWVVGAGEVDGITGATIIEHLRENAPLSFDGTEQHVYSLSDMFFGYIPGSIGETSTFLVILGGVFLLYTGLASWRVILSGVLGGLLCAWLFNVFGNASNALEMLPPWEQLILGSFAFGLVFMATDPVTSAQTPIGKWIYGFLVGFFAILIRVGNPAYPEGIMLSILLCNTIAPAIDHAVISANIHSRTRRWHKNHVHEYR
ncbi:MAG: NADH:ubiquinone reductase (Na(+)-transporting) subunit B [Flavobacteriales bacterium]|nr:NADH:ubiquinone reductase (Na(+)-transporting) subunit B [Flavobacteriales bacterium]